VLLYLEREWDAFDTWCLTRGIDADGLTSRRLVNLTIAHLTDGLERERAETFIGDLERIGNRLLEPATAPPIPDSAPPPGWKSDEENWANIQATLGQMGTIGKAVNRA
jgi:hypothetical protein